MVLSLRDSMVAINGNPSMETTDKQLAEPSDFLDELRSHEVKNRRLLTTKDIQNLELEYNEFVMNYFVYHQQSNTVAEYENSFLQLKRWAETWNEDKFDEKWVVSIFVKGLKEEIKDYVKICCPDSLHRAIVLAKWRELSNVGKVFEESPERELDYYLTPNLKGIEAAQNLGYHLETLANKIKIEQVSGVGTHGELFKICDRNMEYNCSTMSSSRGNTSISVIRYVNWDTEVHNFPKGSVFTRKGITMIYGINVCKVLDKMSRRDISYYWGLYCFKNWKARCASAMAEQLEVTLDADAHQSLIREYGNRGFPTIKATTLLKDRLSGTITRGLGRFNLQGFTTILVFSADKDNPFPYEKIQWNKMGGCCCCCSSKGVELNSSPPFYHYPRVSEEHEPLSSQHGAASAFSTGLLVNTNLETSIIDTYRPPPAPIPYNANLGRPRTPLHHQEISENKNEIAVQATSNEPVKDTNTGNTNESTAKILNKSEGEVQTDIELAPSKELEDELEKSGELKKSSEFIVSVLEEEDVCPTCLEEYDAENPKIITKCENHFHLSCILEWLERSDPWQALKNDMCPILLLNCWYMGFTEKRIIAEYLGLI